MVQVCQGWQAAKAAEAGAKQESQIRYPDSFQFCPLHFRDGCGINPVGYADFDLKRTEFDSG